MKRFGGITCDQCLRIIHKNELSDPGKTMLSKKKRTEMHFCEIRCKLIYFKGRKYYKDKLAKIKSCQ
jgi:hypothetical protein